MLGLIVQGILVINAVVTFFGFVSRDITNALVAQDEGEYNAAMVVYGGLFAIALPLRAFLYYFIAKLGLIWRKWLTESLINEYMTNRTYYVLNPNDEEATDCDNPDQRISEDAENFCYRSLSTILGVFDALITFFMNIFVLLSISTLLTGALFCYSAVTTIILVFVSRRLVRLNFNQQHYEADFRFGLVHIRNNAESIAFYQGEQPEKQEANRRLGCAIHNQLYLIRWQCVITAMQRSVSYAGFFIPYLVMAPIYFRGEIDFGSFLQSKFAFDMVESALMYIMHNTEQIAKFVAGIERLEEFQSKVEEVSCRKQICDSKLASTKYVADVEEAVSTEGIIVREAELRTPGRQLVVTDLSLTVSKGQRMLVVGPSGCGKTSVLRMISGLWQQEKGTVQRPPVGELLFIPQKPYMLLGSLRKQLCYPLDEGSYTDTDLRAVLHEVNLGRLVARYPDLGAVQDWPQLLSLGEQQRLAFGRLLLNAPKFVVLDEATSALDVVTERKLYELLHKKGIAYISVGHRPSLTAFHDQVLELKGQDGGGNWRLWAADAYDFGN
jgi:putative ATP-binding cassette transporter